MFAIIDGKPYLVSAGTAYPTKVMPETKGFIYSSEGAFGYDGPAPYTLPEVIAKCEVLDSMSALKKPEKKPAAKRKTSK